MNKGSSFLGEPVLWLGLRAFGLGFRVFTVTKFNKSKPNPELQWKPQEDPIHYFHVSRSVGS